MNQTNVDVILLTDCLILRTVGAYRIASEIRMHGFTCQTIEYSSSFSMEEMRIVLSRLIGDKTLLIGFSLSFFELLYSRKAHTWSIDWSEQILDEKFPVDDVAVLPLVINTNTNSSTYLSEFELHKDKYYTWDDSNVWNNGNFNYNWAHEVCEEIRLDRQRLRRRSVSGFNSVLRIPPWTNSIIRKPYASIAPWASKYVKNTKSNYKKSILGNTDLKIESTDEAEIELK